MRQLPLAVKLKDSATFATFRPGRNALAVAYLRSVADRRGGPGCWLWGPAGCGKSHLLQAVCAAAGTQSPQAAYLPMSQLSPLGPAVLGGWAEHPVVAVDQLEATTGDRSLETALFRLFNDLAETGGALVVASRSPPAALQFELPDLRSRLAAGSVFQVSSLDEADATAALQLRARHRGFDLPDETARYLLRRVPRDMASLCDWLDRLDIASLAAKRRLTVPFVREVLERDGDAGF